MIYLKDGKTYIKSADGYREVEVYVGLDGSYGFTAKGNTIHMDGALPSYDIHEIIAKFHIEPSEVKTEEPKEEKVAKKATKKK